MKNKTMAERTGCAFRHTAGKSIFCAALLPAAQSAFQESSESFS